MFDAYATGQKPRSFDNKDAAIEWVQQFESGEVRDVDRGIQLWVHYPQLQWV